MWNLSIGKVTVGKLPTLRMTQLIDSEKQYETSFTGRQQDL